MTASSTSNRRHLVTRDIVSHNIYTTPHKHYHSITVNDVEGKRVRFHDVAMNGIYGARMKGYNYSLPETFKLTKADMECKMYDSIPDTPRKHHTDKTSKKI